MTTLSAPSSISFVAAARDAGLVERHEDAPVGVHALVDLEPAGARSISGTKRPFRPYGVGRVRRPSSRTSRKPARRDQADAWRSCARASRWSSSSCRARSRRATAGSTPAAASAASTPKAWLSTVVGTLAMRTSPLCVVDDDQVGEGAADVDAGDASVLAHGLIR